MLLSEMISEVTENEYIGDGPASAAFRERLESIVVGLERERDEARGKLQSVLDNALRLLMDNCEKHSRPDFDDLKGCIICVKSERDEAREALQRLLDVLPRALTVAPEGALKPTVEFAEVCHRARAVLAREGK